MPATEEYLASNARYAEHFSGPLPLPPSRHVAVVACMDARLDEDVWQSIARIKVSPFIPHRDQIRGFVFDVATGKLNEVS